MRRSSKRRRYRPAAEPLSRPQQIKEALMLLDPPEQVDEWRRLVEHALDVLDLRSSLLPSLKGPAAKQGKLEVRRYRNALVRLRIAYRRFGPTTRPWFSLLAADTQEAVIDRRLRAPMLG
jgi:hypothetical protein